jgi:hypothetical protein
MNASGLPTCSLGNLLLNEQARRSAQCTSASRIRSQSYFRDVDMMDEMLAFNSPPAMGFTHSKTVSRAGRSTSVVGLVFIHAAK